MRLGFLFIYTCLLSLILPALFPHLRLFFFAPFIVICFYRCPFAKTLCWALASGFVVDIFSVETRLGIYALSYCLTTYLLYSYKFHFFEDSQSTLPILTYLFVCLATFIQALIFYFTGHLKGLSFEWTLYHFIWMPFLDSLFAFLAFSIPALFFFSRRSRHRFRSKKS